MNGISYLQEVSITILVVFYVLVVTELRILSKNNLVYLKLNTSQIVKNYLTASSSC